MDRIQSVAFAAPTVRMACLMVVVADDGTFEREPCPVYGLAAVVWEDDSGPASRILLFDWVVEGCGRPQLLEEAGREANNVGWIVHPADNPPGEAEVAALAEEVRRRMVPRKVQP